MKNILKFIVFLIYTLLIFFINNLIILKVLFVIHILIGILLKVKLNELFYSMKLLLPFLLLTFVINTFIINLYYGLLIEARIIVCYSITYIFSKTVTVLEMSDIIKKICYPLKIFKVNVDNIGMIVAIALCMVPIFKKEINSLVNTLKSKGMLIKITSIILVMKHILISIIEKSNEMEYSVMAKGYRE